MSQSVLQTTYAPGGIAGRDGPRRKSPRWLVGCLSLLVGGALLIGAIGLGGGLWALSPGEQRSSLAAIGPRTRVALHLRDEPGHAGVDALLDLVGQHVGELNAARKRGQLPEQARWLQDAQPKRNVDADAVRLMLPSELTLALDGAGPEETSLAIANPRHLVRPLRALIVTATPPAELHEVGDAVWMRLGASLLGVHGGNVLWAEQEPQLLAALARLSAEPAASPPSIRRALTPLAARWHVSLYARAPVDELRVRVREELSGLSGSRRPPPERVEIAEREADATLSLGLSVADADTVEGELRWAADDAEAATRLRQTALQGLGELQRLGSEQQLTLTFTELPGGGGVDLRCKGIAAFFDEHLRALSARVEAHERQK